MILVLLPCLLKSLQSCVSMFVFACHFLVAANNAFLHLFIIVFIYGFVLFSNIVVGEDVLVVLALGPHFGSGLLIVVTVFSTPYILFVAIIVLCWRWLKLLLCLLKRLRH